MWRLADVRSILMVTNFNRKLMAQKFGVSFNFLEALALIVLAATRRSLDLICVLRILIRLLQTLAAIS